MTTKKGDPKPHATIEGSAEDVTPASEKPQSAAQKAKTDTAPVEANKTESVADDDSSQTAGQKASPEDDKTSKPPKPVSSGSGSVGTAKLVGAGALGGALSLALLFLAASFEGPARSWLSNVSGAGKAQQSAEDAAALAKSSVAETLAAQETQNAVLADVSATSANLEAQVSQLNTQIAVVTQLSGKVNALSELPAQTSALALRLSASETRLNSIAEAADARSETVNSLASALDEAAKAGTSAAAISTGLSRALSRLESLEPQVAALSVEIVALQSDAAEQRKLADQSEIGTKIEELSAKLASLAARLNSDEKNVAKAQQADDLKRLRQAIDEGVPFNDQLVRFPTSDATTELAKIASTGVASAKMLIDGLADLPGEDITAEAGEGAMGSILGLLGGAVRISRAGDAVLDEAPMVAARKALLADDPGKALDLVRAAKQGPEVDAWAEKAERRAEALDLFTKLTNSLAADLSQPGG